MVIVGVILFDVFESVIMPRWTSRTLRVAPLIADFSWPRWRAWGFRRPEGEKREDFLGTFAPLVLVLILIVWVLGLILGYSLMLHALRGQIPNLQGFGDAFYFAGVSLLTIGFGDITATGGLARLAVLSAAAGGLAVFALVISLIFTLYNAFERREVLVLSLDARAGSPPSGVKLLETYSKYHMVNDLPALFLQWETWAAEVLESHRAYPLLPYFRSSHDNESWVSALGAVLDAATLLVTTVEDVPQDPDQPVSAKHVRGAAQMFYSLGTHTVLDLAHWFFLKSARFPGVERGEFESARRRLERAGFQLREAEAAWGEFSEHRGAYAGLLNDLAKHFATPPTEWIGDRSTVAYLHTVAPLRDESARAA